MSGLLVFAQRSVGSVPSALTKLSCPIGYTGKIFIGGIKLKVQVYMVEVGVLLTPDDEEYKRYRCLPHIKQYSKMSFYDENLLFFFDKEKAIEFAKDYIAKGVEGTYGYVIDYGICNLDKWAIKNIQDYNSSDVCTWVRPEKQDFLFFDYKPFKNK